MQDISATGKLAAISTQFSGSLIINNIYRDCLTILGRSFPFLRYFLSHLQTSQVLHFVLRLIFVLKVKPDILARRFSSSAKPGVFQEGIASLIPFIHHYGQALAARSRKRFRVFYFCSCYSHAYPPTHPPTPAAPPTLPKKGKSWCIDEGSKMSRAQR